MTTFSFLSQTLRGRIIGWAAAAGGATVFLWGGAAAAFPRRENPPARQTDRPAGFEPLKTVSHNGTAAWTDTGIDVKPGEEYYFEAEGSVSLQKGNPVAVCGPEGLGLKTMQQPLPDQNLGGLIGRIRERTEVTVDKDRGERTIRQFGPMFFIGKRCQIAVAAAGRLLLGVNENVVGDNDGRFDVGIFKKTASHSASF